MTIQYCCQRCKAAQLSMHTFLYGDNDQAISTMSQIARDNRGKFYRITGNE